MVVGASGFVGSSLANYLLKAGYDVAVFYRKQSNLSRLGGIVEKITHITGDLNDTRSYEEAVAKFGPEIWFHCAWSGITGKYRNDVTQFTINIPATMYAFDLAVKVGVKRWIGLGSQAEYGPLNRRISETMEPKPTTSYGQAKLITGEMLTNIGARRDIETVWLRLFDVYGPGDNDAWFLPYCVKKALAGEVAELTPCEQVWDFLYIDDLCGALLKCAKMPELHGIFNIGSGETVLLKDAVNYIFSTVGNGGYKLGAFPYGPNQVMHLEADITKLNETTGWYPETPFYQGLYKTINHLKNTYAPVNEERMSS